MLTRPLRRAAVPVIAVATLLSAPSAAVADPPSPAPDPCSVLLARAAVWPGGFEDESGFHRLVSDAYVSHLSAQPPCSSSGD